MARHIELNGYLTIITIIMTTPIIHIATSREALHTAMGQILLDYKHI